MKFYLYCILTQLIVWLGKLRTKLIEKGNIPLQQRYDRTFYASTNERWLCCDCELEHLTMPLFKEEPRDPAFRFVPIRIKGYDYRLRYGSGGSSACVDESAKDKWTGEKK